MNQGITIAVGLALWLTTTAICIFYVMRYAKKVKETNGAASILTPAELQAAQEAHGKGEGETTPELTGRRKAVLWIFALSFVVMILGVVPWEKFGINIFTGTDWFNGTALGNWYFPELTVWFLIMSVVIGLVYGMNEKSIVDAILAGAADMIGVAIVIGISRGVSFMMTNSGLDLLILDKACGALNGVSGALFADLAYVIYIGLSFLIPSTSGLATVSMPIFAPLAQNLGIAPEIMVSAFSAGCGIVNFITPTSGVVMGGLAISKVEYSSWLKFTGKLLLMVLIANIVVLSVTAMIL